MFVYIVYIIKLVYIKMGNQSNKETQQESFRKEDWLLLEKHQDCIIWRHQNRPSLMIEERSLPYKQGEQFQQIMMYLYRKKCPYLVNAYLLQEQKNDEICKSHTKRSFFLERIPIRLSLLQHVPFPDYLHIFQAAFQGFSHLVNYKRKYFSVTEDMIGLNIEGNARVWMNQDFWDNQFKHPDVSQQKMVRSIIESISNCIDKRLPPNIPLISSYFYRNEDTLTFQEAYGEFKNYVYLYNSGMIPNRLECIHNVGGTDTILKQVSSLRKQYIQNYQNSKINSYYNLNSNLSFGNHQNQIISLNNGYQNHQIIQHNKLQNSYGVPQIHFQSKAPKTVNKPIVFNDTQKLAQTIQSFNPVRYNNMLSSSTRRQSNQTKQPRFSSLTQNKPPLTFRSASPVIFSSPQNILQNRPQITFQSNKIPNHINNNFSQSKGKEKTESFVQTYHFSHQKTNMPVVPPLYSQRHAISNNGLNRTESFTQRNPIVSKPIYTVQVTPGIGSRIQKKSEKNEQNIQQKSYANTERVNKIQTTIKFNNKDYRPQASKPQNQILSVQTNKNNNDPGNQKQNNIDQTQKLLKIYESQKQIQNNPVNIQSVKFQQQSNSKITKIYQQIKPQQKNIQVKQVLINTNNYKEDKTSPQLLMLLSKPQENIITDSRPFIKNSQNIQLQAILKNYDQKRYQNPSETVINHSSFIQNNNIDMQYSDATKPIQRTTFQEKLFQKQPFQMYQAHSYQTIEPSSYETVRYDNFDQIKNETWKNQSYRIQSVKTNYQKFHLYQYKSDDVDQDKTSPDFFKKIMSFQTDLPKAYQTQSYLTDTKKTQFYRPFDNYKYQQTKFDIKQPKFDSYQPQTSNYTEYINNLLSQPTSYNKINDNQKTEIFKSDYNFDSKNIF